jgi:hypothetical protein
MKNVINNFQKVTVVLLIGAFLMGGITSCKSKKKLAREKAAAEYAQKVKEAKRDLTAIINGETGWSLDKQAQRVKDIKDYNIDDTEVIDLIKRAEEKINMLKAEAERKAEEEKLRREEEAKRRMQQSQYATYDNTFGSIAAAPDIKTANGLIDEALNYFASPDVPVLIIISRYNGINDYDRPTTASRFLNYLKDKKEYKYRVESLKKDSFGKITELELIKK